MPAWGVLGVAPDGLSFLLTNPVVFRREALGMIVLSQPLPPKGYESQHFLWQQNKAIWTKSTDKQSTDYDAS